MAVITCSELPALAREVLARARDHTSARAFLVFLQGELGSGKTTFMQTLGRELGITATVQSPTFVLMKKYDIQDANYDTLVHIDAYRLNGAKEFQALRPEQFVNNPHAIVCIEWPEKVAGALPTPDLVLKFAHTGEEQARNIELIERIR